MNASCLGTYHIDAIHAETSNRKIRKALKEHVCCECKTTIQKGERYEIVKGLWDREWRTLKTCLPCAAIGNDLPCARIHEGLRVQVQEVYGFDYVTGEDYDTFVSNPKTGREHRFRECYLGR